MPSSTKRPVLLIDWSVQCYQNWFGMKSPNYTARSDQELVEFARNLASDVFELQRRFDPVETIFALDHKLNWRVPYFRSYYRKHVEYWKDCTRAHSWVVAFDKKVYHCTLDAATEKWFFDKMNKEGLAALELDRVDRWTHWPAGNTPEWIREAYPEAPETVHGTADWAGLSSIVPEYKGNRKTGKWPFETSKAEFKELGVKIGYNLGATIGAKVVQVPHAEGDDIVHFASYLWPDRTKIICSIDQDLHQVLSFGQDVQYWDVGKKIWVDKEIPKVRFDLLCKILGGDSADNICGCSLAGAGSTFPTVSWEDNGAVKDGKNTVKWVRNALDATGGDIGAVYRLLDKEADLPSFERNLNLVYMPNVPGEVAASIRQALQDATVAPAKYTLEDYGFTERDQRVAYASAMSKREQDLAEARYGMGE